MNEIEEKFYKCFDIKPKYYDACTLEDKYWNEQLDNQYGTFDSYLSFECPHYDEGCYSTCEYAYDKVTYPEITDRILLELICIVNDLIHYKDKETENPETVGNKYFSSDIDSLKEEILFTCLCQKQILRFHPDGNKEEELKQRVQSLFTEKK